MIVMAIDHSSYFIGKIHYSEFWGIDFDSYNNCIWFISRLTSHICAPGFFFLMGISIVFLIQSRISSGWKRYRIKRFLFTRGLLLIIIEVFIETPAWIMGDAFSAIEMDSTILPGIKGSIYGNFGILSSLGASMILSSFLSDLDKRLLLLLTILGIIASYIYVSIQSNQFDQPKYLISIFLIPGNWPPIRITYSILPWLFICLLGVVWAKYYKDYTDRIFRYTSFTGLIMITLFIILRFMHYGNFQLDHYSNLTAFFTLIKYPASISFLLFTLGIVFILFGFLSNIKALSLYNPIIIFGKTALFFYIIHLYIYLVFGLLFPYGTTPVIMYIFWLMGLILLYILCKQYYKFKQRKNLNSIWRFF